MFTVRLSIVFAVVFQPKSTLIPNDIIENLHLRIEPLAAGIAGQFEIKWKWMFADVFLRLNEIRK